MGDAREEWVVCKYGRFYRPNAAGYTSHLAEAGRWTKEEAEAYAAVEPANIRAVYAPLASPAPAAAGAVVAVPREVWNLLLTAVRPFHNATFDDNGDVTVSPCDTHDYARLSRAYRKATEHFTAPAPAAAEGDGELPDVILSNEEWIRLIDAAAAAKARAEKAEKERDEAEALFRSTSEKLTQSGFEDEKLRDRIAELERALERYKENEGHLLTELADAKSRLAHALTAAADKETP